MSASGGLAEEWRGRLGALPATHLLDLDPQAVVPGRWERLDKHGLGGRERWRLVLDVQPGSGEPAVFYLKRYRAWPLREQWDRVWRQLPHRSRAYWEYLQSQNLAEASVPAAPAVAYAEEMRGLLERRSAVLLASVAGDGLDRVWAQLLRERAPVTVGLARFDLCRRLGRFVAAFHGTGICHRDLYLCHIFARVDREGLEPPRFALIDLARAHRPKWRRMRWLLKDLSQLDCSARQCGASRTDRLRTLLAYLGLEPGAVRARWYVRRIVSRSDRILRRIARKGQ